ncbi:hypothetical protein LCGC14_2785050 [marine sediment metagenome]|uniref:Uncharacterized protein n=1 Tax=marine sediment metagenome TaxID=412755 RepID=A0A0F8YS62_9ZZZZ
MSDITTATELRRRILKEHGLVPPKPPAYFLPDAAPYDESAIDFRKTNLMKYIETKYIILLKQDIYRGSINDVCSRYGWEVDRSTISRWRKIIRRYLIQ